MISRIFQWAKFATLPLLAFTVDASATTYSEEKFECPIGGEKFKSKVVVSNITFGQRPDGKPYSPLPVYPIVECPDNGFLLFDEEFTDEELARLAIAIASPEFLAMRRADTPYYRAAWLQRQIDRNPILQLNTLLRATWETDDNWDRKVRYQVEFVNMAQRVERTDENARNWFWLNLRAINAMRELGYYEGGLKRLDFVTAPERMPEDPNDIEYANFYADRLRALMLDKNPTSEPANLVPPEIARFRCVIPRFELTSAELVACNSTKVKEAIAAFEYKPKGSKRMKGEQAILAADAARHSSRSSH